MKPVGVVRAKGSTIVVCTNGAVWTLQSNETWVELPPIPGSKRHSAADPDGAKAARKKARAESPEPEPARRPKKTKKRFIERSAEVPVAAADAANGTAAAGPVIEPADARSPGAFATVHATTS